MTTATKLSLSDTRKLAKEVAKLLTMPSKPVTNRAPVPLPAPSTSSPALSATAYSELRLAVIAARRRLAHVKKPDAKLKFICQLSGMLLTDALFENVSLSIESTPIPDGWIVRPGRPRKQ